MALSLGTLSGILDLNIRPLTSSVDRADARLGRFKRQAGAAGTAAGKAAGDGMARGMASADAGVQRSHRGLLRMFAGVGVRAAATFGGIAIAAGFMGLKIASGNEQAQISFSTMLDSGKDAEKFLTKLRKFAEATPFEFPELQTAASGLISTGIEANKVIPIMTTLGNITSGRGTGSEGIKRAVVALQQMSSAGRISAEDLNQLRDAGVPLDQLWAEMAPKLGTTASKLNKMSREGKLGKKELNALMQVMQDPKSFKMFAGMMDKQSRSLGGLWSTLKDTFGQGMATAIQPAIPVLKQGLGLAIKFVADNAPKMASGVKWIINEVKGGAPHFKGLATWVRMAVDRLQQIDKKDVAAFFRKVKDAVAVLLPIIRDFGASLPAIGPTVEIAGKAFSFMADHIDLVAKALPWLIGALIAYRAAQALNNTLGRESLIGFALQIGSTIALAVANRNLARSQVALAVTQGAVNKQEQIGLLTRARMTAGIIISTVASKIARGAALAWAAAQWLLNAAMTANPIGIVIVLLAALVGGLIIAYKRSETFRKIVHAALHAVGTAFKWLWARAVEAWNGLKRVWKEGSANLKMRLAEARKGITDWAARVKAIFQGILRWISSTWKAGWSLIRRYIIDPVLKAYNWLVSRIALKKAQLRALTTWIASTFRPLFARITGWIKNPVESARAAIVKIIDRVKTTFTKGVAAIKTTWNKLEAIAKKPVKFIIDTVLNGGLIKAYNWVIQKFLGKGKGTIDPIKIKGYEEGGPTGSSASDHQIAGVTHANEHVVTAKEVRRTPGGHGWWERVRAMAAAGVLPGFFFGGRSPVGGDSGWNRHRSGYGFATWAGDKPAGTGTPVHAWKAGTTAQANRWNYSYGNHVRVNHGGGEQSLYAHLSAILTRVGERLSQGETLGLVGSTGNSTGPHLHFEIRGGSASQGKDTGLLSRVIDYLAKFKDRILGPFNRLRELGSSTWATMIKAGANKLKDAAIDKVTSAQSAFAAKFASSGSGSFSAVAGGSNRAIGKAMMLQRWPAHHWDALNALWTQESGWNHRARNPSSGAYGIPQSLPANKMASAGPNWRTDPGTQIKWGLGYIADRYGSPSNAWTFHRGHNWYELGTPNAAPGFGWTAEKGAELVVNPQLRRFRGGEQVIDAKATKQLMGGGLGGQQPLVGQLVLQSSGDVHDDMDEVAWQLRRIRRGGVYASGTVS